MSAMPQRLERLPRRIGDHRLALGVGRILRGVEIDGDGDGLAVGRIQHADVIHRTVAARAGLVRDGPAGRNARLQARLPRRRRHHPFQKQPLESRLERRVLRQDQPLDIAGRLRRLDGVLVAVRPVQFRLQPIHAGRLIADAAIEGAQGLQPAHFADQDVGGGVVADFDRALHQLLDGQGRTDGRLRHRGVADHVGLRHRDRPVQPLLPRLNAQQGGGGQIHLEGRAIDKPLVAAPVGALAFGQDRDAQTAAGADGDAQDRRRMGAVAQAVAERVQNQRLFHLGHGLADKATGHGVGGLSRLTGHAGVIGRGGGGGGSLPAQQRASVRQADGVDVDLGPGRQQHRAVHGVFQLAHVAGPAVSDQGASGLRADGARRHAVGGGVFLDEVVGQHGDVAGAFAQRRQAQVHDVQPVQQVFAERPLGHRLGQVAVGGGDDADVDGHRLGAADAVDHPLLNGAQQLGLKAGVHFADFVQQKRAAVGLLELADAARHGAGKGPLLVTEQLGFQQVIRDGGAVDADEGLVRTTRAAVQIAGHHLLTDAAFAGDQDGGFRTRHLIGQLDDRLHRRISRDHRPLVIRHRRQDGGDQVRLGRQGDELLGPGADGVGRFLGVSVDAAGHDRHMNALGVVGGDQGGDVDAVVDHQQVRALPPAQLLGRLIGALDVLDLGAVRHGHLHRRRQLAA
uniref:PE-PGRS family protein n=1 Tax=Parastrongyloides trichosuri TaxID=131310 RepID=A0A0N5A5Z1_PARTI